MARLPDPEVEEIVVDWQKDYKQNEFFNQIGKAIRARRAKEKKDSEEEKDET